MPTVLIIGPYLFRFYSSDRPEPPHIHVVSGRRSAKVWLDPIRLQSSVGYSAREQREVLNHVRANRDLFLTAWHDYFDE